jgi:hypothetical protein
MAAWTPDQECAGRLGFIRWCRDRGSVAASSPWDRADMSAFEKRRWMDRATSTAEGQIS